MCSEPCPVKADHIEVVVDKSKATASRLIFVSGYERGDKKMPGKSKRWLLMFLAGLITMTTFSGPAEASEFLADVVMKGGMMSGNGKVWVKGQKMRQEMGAGAEKMITIMDLDQGFQWILMPDSKMYFKTEIQAKGKGFRPENFVGMQQGPMEAQLKRLGIETIKGYKCDKYLLTFKNKQMGTMMQWFSIKLGYPIKIVNQSDMMGEVTTELQNIKKTSVRDDLFIVPSHYQEMPGPQIPQMPTENQ
jgi:outer membrane lipoprotein-sorting protein